MIEEQFAEETLPSSGSPVPIWKVAVIGFSFMSVGLTIGLSPSYAVELAGNGAAFAQMLGLAAMFAIAVAVSAFAKRHVVSGSLMSYVYFAFGRSGRALVGGFQLCGYLAMAASITAATQIFMIGVLSDLGVASSAHGIQVLSILALVAGSCFFTCRGLEASVKLSVGLAVISIPPVALIALLAAVRHGLAFRAQFNVAHMSLDGVVQGAMATLAFLIAFEGLSTLAAETADPKRSIPRLLYLLLSVSGGCGVVATLLDAPLLLENKATLDAGASPIALLSDLAGVPWMRLPADILLVVTGFAAMIAVCTFAARIFAVASMDGILPRWLAQVDGVAQTPRRAAIIVSTVTAVALLIPLFVGNISPVSLGSIYGSSVVTFWLVPYALICLAAIVQEIRTGSAELPVLIGSFLGFSVMLFMLFRTLTIQDASILAWVPWVVFASAIPVAIWFFMRSGTAQVRDF